MVAARTLNQNLRLETRVHPKEWWNQDQNQITKVVKCRWITFWDLCLAENVSLCNVMEYLVIHPNTFGIIKLTADTQSCNRRMNEDLYSALEVKPEDTLTWSPAVLFWSAIICGFTPHIVHTSHGWHLIRFWLLQFSRHILSEVLPSAASFL